MKHTRTLETANTLLNHFICRRCLDKAARSTQGQSCIAAKYYHSRKLQTPARPLRPFPSTSAITKTSHITNVLPNPRRPLHTGGTPPTTLEEHQREVERVATSVRSFYDRKEKFRIHHGSTNSTRKSALGRDPRTVVDTSRLNHVVKLDVESQTALVEPNVPMDRLVEETLKYGLVPPVVMEFPGITVGGGYAGTAGESSSFKHGFFDRTLNKVEIVLANGEIVTASEHQHPDLLRGAAGAVGTLGVTTMVELQLRKATKFVETTYHPVFSMEEAIEKLQDFTSRPDDLDYVDGIMYSPTSGAIVTGRMTDTPSSGLSIQRFSDPKDPWFYLYVKDKISKHQAPTSDAIPLPDYLFRYDRGGFWVGEAPFDYFPGVPFNDFTRWWLDDFLHTRMLYNALHASGRSEQMIVQDLALPYDTAADFVRRMDDMLKIWPLWLCPLKQSPQPTMHPHYNAYEADGKTLKPMLNIGLWGKAPPTHEGYIQANQAIEATLQDLRGMKWLYAQTYFSEPDFWRDFDKQWYESLREKYHATTLPTVWEKVRVDIDAERKAKEYQPLSKKILDMWPVSGLYGLKKSIDSGDYLQARKPAWKEWVPRT
ncbi:Delta(24)-sterol reductase [Lecanosticta acicola]|uniref:Delta(24)-sterol reductase n=1 Tax=Lecanosticta acicola TaxID=111012 RepID=A0AAI8YVP0_9PEZI|nr:Delta(24)-sterol reductase [Lecanosticta acicola]